MNGQNSWSEWPAALADYEVPNPVQCAPHSVLLIGLMTDAKREQRLARRQFLVTTGVVVAAPLITMGQKEEKLNPDEGVTAPEDLMKEHGVPDRFRNKSNKLAVACASFIRMYRPHEARKDTVLFPALPTILAPKQVEALGDRMEEDEHKILGDEGFEKSVDQVAAIEKQLGSYELSQFTPKM